MRALEREQARSMLVPRTANSQREPRPEDGANSKLSEGNNETAGEYKNFDIGPIFTLAYLRR